MASSGPKTWRFTSRPRRRHKMRAHLPRTDGLRSSMPLPMAWRSRWWECVDPEPFHTLLSQPKARGPVIRAFAAILTAATPGAWGQAAWLLRVPEVQTVVNLLAIRQQLVPAIRWLYEKHRSTLHH